MLTNHRKDPKGPAVETEEDEAVVEDIQEVEVQGRAAEDIQEAAEDDVILVAVHPAVVLQEAFLQAVDVRVAGQTKNLHIKAAGATTGEVR